MGRSGGAGRISSDWISSGTPGDLSVTSSRNAPAAVSFFAVTRNLRDWKRLQGPSYWRLREGSFPAICEIRDDELLILVLKVGSRGDVYK